MRNDRTPDPNVASDDQPAEVAAKITEQRIKQGAEQAQDAAEAPIADGLSGDDTDAVTS